MFLILLTNTLSKTCTSTAPFVNLLNSVIDEVFSTLDMEINFLWCARSLLTEVEINFIRTHKLFLK